MQIALCHENVLPERGGAEMYVADFARRLAAAGHEVHLYACRWNASALPADIVVHRIPPLRGSRTARPWRLTAAMQAALTADRPEISMAFDKIFGTDIYYPLGGLQPASARGNIRKHRTATARLSAKIAKRFDPAQWSNVRLERRYLLGPTPPLLVVNSELVRRQAARYYGLDADRIRVIHNAIDPKRFDERNRPRIRVEERRRCGFGPGDVVAAFIGMNYHLKGLEPLLHALTLIPTYQPLKIIVAGGSRTAPWVRLAQRLGVERRVAFVGPCEDVRRVYFAADLHVHPTFYDPCSGVVLEALACGLPVITSRFNGAAELLPVDGGFVLDDPHDTSALASRLLFLLDPVNRDHAARAVRRAAAGWTIEHHYQRWLELFREVALRRAA